MIQDEVQDKTEEALPDMRTVEPADLFRLTFVTGGQLSPDGKRVAYTISHVDAEEEKEYSAIWLMTLATGETHQFTSGKAVDSQPRWSPDGTQIAFLSTRSDTAQIYIIPVDGGEARAVTSLKQGVGGGIAWSPDGDQIAFTAVPIEEPRDPAKPYRVTRHVYRFNGMEYLDDVVQSLYVIDVAGGEPRRLTEDRLMYSEPQWSPDGTEILVSTSMIPDIHNTFFSRLGVFNVASGAVRELLPNWGNQGAAAWTPDGQKIAFTGQPSGFPIGTKDDLWIVNRAGGTPEKRSASLKVGVGGGLQGDFPVMMDSGKLLLTSDGNAAYVPVQDGGTVQIYRIALEGAESFTSLVNGDRTCFPLGADDQHLVYLVSAINHPIDLFTSAIDGSGEQQLTHLNDEFLATLKLPTVEHLLFPSSDGVQVEGWILLPAEGEAPYPMTMAIHGGPHGAYGYGFHFDMQMMAGAGYAVLFINHRASTGYGNEFSTAIKGDWGHLDYDDLMAGVDLAIAKGYADPDRMGIFGLSGGGNLSCCIVAKTRRFKAAVPENPVTNWVSFYGVSDIGAWFAVEELGGHPWEIPEVYARNSPITLAHTCTTPTLLIQGEHDWRCPAEQSEQFYTTLKANGCPVEMVRLPNSSHAESIFGNVTVRRVQNEATLEWMNRYVLGKSE